MRKSVTVVTPPSGSPVTTDQLIAWAKIDPNEDADTLQMLIDTATDAAEKYMNRSLITRTLKLTLDVPQSKLADSLGDGVYDLPVTALNGCLPQAIDLPQGPIQDDVEVRITAISNTSSVYDPSNYFIDTTGSRVVLNRDAQWPYDIRPKAGCAVEYDAGYGDSSSDIPAAIRNGILIHAASLYEQRGQCDDAMDIPPGAKQLYNQYRVFGGTVA